MIHITPVGIFLDTKDDLQDFFAYLEGYEGAIFIYDSVTYKVSNNIKDFIKTYGEDSAYQSFKLPELLSNELIEVVHINDNL